MWPGILEYFEKMVNNQWKLANLILIFRNFLTVNLIFDKVLNSLDSGHPLQKSLKFPLSKFLDICLQLFAKMRENFKKIISEIVNFPLVFSNTLTQFDVLRTSKERLTNTALNRGLSLLRDPFKCIFLTYLKFAQILPRKSGNNCKPILKLAKHTIKIFKNRMVALSYR